MTSKEEKEKKKSKMERIIEKIDDEFEKLDWMKNNMIIQGWNIGSLKRRLARRRLN